MSGVATKFNVNFHISHLRFWFWNKTGIPRAIRSLQRSLIRAPCAKKKEEKQKNKYVKNFKTLKINYRELWARKKF